MLWSLYGTEQLNYFSNNYIIGRHGIKPSIGERSIRKPPSFDAAQSYVTNVTDETSKNFERLQITTAETEGLCHF